MNESAMTLHERLEALLYQYVRLYERWSEDRQVFAQKGAELSQALAAMQTEIKHLSTIEASVRRSLSSELQSVVQATQKAVVLAATGEAKKSLEQAEQRFRAMIAEVDRAFRQTAREVVQSRWQWFTITVLSAVLGGLLFAWFLLPHRLYQLTQQQADLVSMGGRLLTIINHMPKKERQQLFRQLERVNRY